MKLVAMFSLKFVDIFQVGLKSGTNTRHPQ